MLHRLAQWLVVIGALNWLLVGLFHFDVVAYLFGGMSGLISRIVYVVIGLAGVYLLPQVLGAKVIRSK